MASNGLIHRDYFSPLMRALYARLELSGGLTDPAKISDINGTAVPVCQFVAKDTAMPYIVIGVNETIDTFSCKQQAGEQVLATIRVFSKYDGAKEVSKIAGEVINEITKDVLDLSADGMAVANYRLQGPNLTIPEPDNVWQRVINILFFITDTATVQA